ncbi:O-Glycosyl hydrolase [Bacteroidales bacterium Barb4]|nr:O-Glycosyl hydrolase [Bacteroidales bacterium Barb4]
MILLPPYNILFMKAIGNLLFAVLCLLVPSFAGAQTEVMAWGNMTGVRVDGELMEFESSLRVAERGWSSVEATGKERQFRPLYIRDGQKQTVKTAIDRIRFEQTVNDLSKGNVAVSLTMISDTSKAVEGVYFALDIPAKRYDNGSVRIGSSETALAILTEGDKVKKLSGNRIIIEGTGRKLQLDFASSVTAFLRKEAGNAATLYIQLASASVRKGQTERLNFTLQTTGEINNRPATIAIHTDKPGRLFAGLGGNFRLQNPQVDPKIIDYCLDNLRVAWGRVELPWRIWQPEENSDPIADARAGRLDERVTNAMKMAQRLAAKGMPVIVSAWFPPAWAIEGDPASYVRHGGVQAFRLDADKQQQIYKSLTDYLVYLKEEYGVEATAYSFNESDLGIDVLHTPQEHAAFIKGLGAEMAARGLATKMLLGDNSDATTYDFILPGMNDPEAQKYIAAVSFHSWRGCDDETLRKWGDAARRLNVPLIVGEGSTDAAAHTYPMIFAESTFALYEINLYIRICAISQPVSILQWQLTSDYSILWGDGVYGSTGALRPTQRFWNLKQLASTPEGSFSLPFDCNQEDVNCAAFGNKARGEYTLHVVNNGAAREAVVTGLPPTLSRIKVYGTDSNAGMKELPDVKAENGTVRLNLPAMSFVSLMAAEK